MNGARSERFRRENEVLQTFVTAERLRRMEDVLADRTRFLTVALEDIYQPHNASAVLRSCDAFGVQDVHIVENRNRYQLNPGVELGSAQWLTLERYGPAEESATLERTRECITELRRQGYRVVATSPHRSGVAPEELRLEPGPIALLFGTEKEGLSPLALDQADEHLAIPMHGFVESLNISVSVAVTVRALMLRVRSEELPWRLSDEERVELLNRWLKASVRHAEQILTSAMSGRDPR